LTLIEMIVVLLIIVLLAGALTIGYGRLPATALKREAVHVAATLRAAYDGAAASGAYHRLVIDIDEATYKVERCEGKLVIQRARDVKEEMESMKAAAEKAAQLAADAQAQAGQGPGGTPLSPDAMLLGIVGQAQPGANAAIGGAGGEATARCVPMPGPFGKAQKLGGHPQVGFSRVWVGHLEDPAQHGKVMIHFFPLGTAEKAIIELGTDADNLFTIALQPISGRIDMQQGALARPEDFFTTDATGSRI
jgi:type II secretory pathway pseudopilin PulG